MAERAWVYVVDDDVDLASSVARLLQRHGYRAEPFSDPADLLAGYETTGPSCVVTDVMMGSEDGFEFAGRVRVLDPAAAFVFMTAWPSSGDAVDAVRLHGGVDYLEKPIDEGRLLAAIAEGVAWSAQRGAALARVQRLTRREREVFDLLVRGFSNKAVAAQLQLSPKTVEDHRAAIMQKTQAENVADLIAIERAIRAMRPEA
jgi:two-component system response regulator FixJ